MRRDATVLHVGIVSVLFDRKPEGICTGRLVRALLDAGLRVSVFTSSKAAPRVDHPRLRLRAVSHRPREPRFLFDLLAVARGEIPNGFYAWGRRVASLPLEGDDVPDVFYGRAWPLASLVPALGLARRFDRPLMIHLSDPIPPPTDSGPPPRRLRQSLATLFERAGAITFTNEPSIEYQRRVVPFPRERGHVLNHVGPEPSRFGPPGDARRFCHLGTIRPDRPARPLLDGFRIHLREFPDSSLDLVGAPERHVRRDIVASGLASSVRVLPYTDDVAAALAGAGVLVAIDADLADPIYTPTKIVEYLRTDRPVLALTPAGSPVDRLLARSPGTTVTATDYRPEAIARALGRARSLRVDSAAFEERFRAMADFDAGAVAGAFVTIVDRLRAMGSSLRP